MKSIHWLLLVQTYCTIEFLNKYLGGCWVRCCICKDLITFCFLICLSKFSNTWRSFKIYVSHIILFVHFFVSFNFGFFFYFYRLWLKQDFNTIFDCFPTVHFWIVSMCVFTISWFDGASSTSTANKNFGWNKPEQTKLFILTNSWNNIIHSNVTDHN